MADEQLSDGQMDEQDLRNSGYSDQDISQWKGQTADTLSQAGYSDQEIAQHFGVKEPDVSAMKAFVKGNLQKFSQEQKTKHETVDTSLQPVKAQDWLDSLAAGWGMSASGLDLDKGKSPIETPGDASRGSQLANMAGQIAGDAPAMIVGGGIGALGVGIATANPVAAGIGAYAGAQALPKAMRQILMDHYEKGDITTASEFMTRLKDTSMEALKGGTVGALTGAAGSFVGKFGTPIAQLAAEGATMTAAGAAVEGKLPNSNDFINSAITMGGLHALGVVPSLVPKLRNIFSETGVPPEQAVEATHDNVVLKQEMASDNPDLPKEAQGIEPPFDNIEVSKNALVPFGPVEDGPEVNNIIPTNKTDPDSLLPDRPPPPPEGPKGPEREAQEIEDARANIRSRLGEEAGKPEEAALSWAKFRKDFVDDLDPVKAASKAMAEGKDLAADKDPYQLMQRAKNWRAQLKYMLKYGTIDFNTGENNGEGMAAILKDVDDPDKFRDFAMAMRAKERSYQEKETGIDQQSAETVILADKEKYLPQFRRLVDFQNRALKYATDSGILGKENYKNIVDGSRSYIPLYRVQDEAPFIDKPNVGQGKLFQEMKGSERLILDPFQSIAYNLAAIIKKAEKNRALTAFTNQVKESMTGDYYAENTTARAAKAQAEAPPAGAPSDYAPDIEVPQRVLPETPRSAKQAPPGSGMEDIEVPQKELSGTGAALQEREAPGALGDVNVPEQVAEKVSDEQSTSKRPLGKNEYEIYEDGKRQVWRTTEDLSDAFKSLDYHPGLSGLLGETLSCGH